MSSDFSRRNFLLGSSALASKISVPSTLAIYSASTKPARADGGATAAIVIAAVQATISLASSLGAFGSRAGGMGQRLQSINIRLNQILENQERILEAISAVNGSIEALGRKVEFLFRDNRFKEGYEEASKIHENINSLVKEVRAVPSKLESTDYYEKTFLKLREKLQDAITGLDRKVSEGKMDNEGVPTAVLAVQTAYILAEAQRMYAKLEYMFDSSIKRELWVPHVAFQSNIENLEKIVDTLRNDRFAEAKLEQDQKLTAQKRLVDSSLWSGFSTHLLASSPTETIEDNLDGFAPSETTVEILFGDVTQMNIPKSPCRDLRDGGRIYQQIERLDGSKPNSEDFILPLYRPDSDGAMIIDAQSYSHNVVRGVERVTFKVVTAALNGPATDTIVSAIKTGQLSGTSKTIYQNECGVGTISQSEQPSPANILSNIPKARYYGADIKPPATLKSTLDGGFAAWQLAVANHAHAQAYIFALSKLIPVLDNIQKHNEGMRKLFLPALEKAHAARSN